MDGRQRVAIFRIQAFKTSETFIRAQAAALRRWEPVFVGLRAHGERPEGADDVELPQDAKSRLRAGMLRDLSPLVGPLRERGVALIHAHFAPDAVFALSLAQALGVPLIVTLHGFDVTRTDASLLASGRAPLIWSVIGRRALQRRAAAFVAVSSFVAEQAVARGYPPDRLHLLPIGVGIPPTSAVAPEPGLIVHVGRLVEKKGAAVVLDALAVLRARGIEARLSIVGDGPLRAALQAQVARLGLGDRITFHGALAHADTLALIARATVLAAPSLPGRDGDREGLPTAILEAMARSVPVVATTEAGIPEAVADGVTGFLVTPRDPPALAEGLARVLAAPDLRDRLGAAGRAVAAERFDILRQTKSLEALYERVAAARP